MRENVNFVSNTSPMDTTKLRERLHSYIDQLDESFLKALYAMLEEYTKGEVKLTEAEKKAVDEGLADIEKGNVYTHEEVMERLREKYPHLHK